MRWTTRLAAVALLLVSPAWAEEETPRGALVEAEAVEGAGEYAAVIDDPDASGERAVTSGEAYRPLFRQAVSEDWPDRLALWVRHRGGPLQLKFRVDGNNEEVKWLWAKPERYTWSRFGVYDRDDMGDRVEIIRGGGEAPRVDAVVIEPVEAAGAADAPQDAAEAGIDARAAAGRAIPPARPSPGLPPIQEVLTVDWSADEGRLTASHWGVALYHAVDGRAADDAGYVDFLTAARPGLVRIHRADQGKFWMNPDKQRFDDGLPAWNVEAIGRALAPVRAIRDAGLDVTLMIDHGYWPTWFSAGKYVEPERYEQAASLTRELVEAVAQTGVRVDRWEVLNEADNLYAKRSTIEAMGDLFNVLAGAIRQADPQAVVGGPAFTWANPEWVEPFLDRCGDAIDFISWHNYAGGSPTVPNDTLFAQTRKIADHAADVREQLARRGLNDVATYLTEFNVQWTWAPFERRHANNVGAAFQAATVVALAQQQVTGVAVWHAKGNAYGLIDSDDRVRATGQLYLLSPWLRGRIGSATLSGGPAMDRHSGLALLAVPVTRDDGGRSLLLVNRSEATVDLTASTDAIQGLDRSVRIDAEGLLVEEVTPGPWRLPGWSVTLVTDAETGLEPGRHDLPGQHVSFDW